MMPALSPAVRITRLEQQHDVLTQQLALAAGDEERHQISGTLDFVTNVLGMLREREQHRARRENEEARLRQISFQITPAQVVAQTKDVTRRVGWKDLTPGTVLQPVEKCQGLKKGEKVKKLGGPVRVVSVRRERLGALLVGSEAYGRAEVIREGFPQLSPREFVEMFKRSHRKVTDSTRVTRIEFEYLAPIARA